MSELNPQIHFTYAGESLGMHGAKSGSETGGKLVDRLD